MGINATDNAVEFMEDCCLSYEARSILERYRALIEHGELIL